MSKFVFGYAAVCKVQDKNGKFIPYVDLEGDHIPEEEMYNASVGYMEGDRIAKHNHEGEQIGVVVFGFPLTEEIANSMEISVKKTGFIIGMRIDSEEVAEKIKKGMGFSVGGTAYRIEMKIDKDIDIDVAKNLIEERQKIIQESFDVCQIAYHTDFIQCNNPQKAIDKISGAIEINPHDHKAFAIRGFIHFSSGDMVNAIEDLNEAIKLKNNVSAYYGIRGICHSERGNNAKALHDLSTAIHYDPKNFENYMNRATFYFVNGKYEKSIRDYRESFNLKPDNFNALEKIELAQGLLKKYEESFKTRCEIIELRGFDMESEGRVKIEKSLSIQTNGIPQDYGKQWEKETFKSFVFDEHRTTRSEMRNIQKEEEPWKLASFFLGAMAVFGDMPFIFDTMLYPSVCVVYMCLVWSKNNKLRQPHTLPQR